MCAKLNCCSVEGKDIEKSFANMVISRNGTAIQLKEAINVPPPRHITKRVAELPSLRYGTIGTKTRTSGPLRVTNQYNCETIPRMSKKTTSSVAPSDETSKPIRPPRRVRFNLPATEGDVNTTDASGGGVYKPTAGDGWLRTRFPASCHLDQQPLRIDSDHISSHVERLDDIYQRRSESAAASVPVSVSPGIRTRVHPTGRYIRGTLSPTSSTTAPAAPNPGAQLLLRAARDGDDNVLRELLRRAVIVGIAEQDLNATDNSGRTILSYVASNGSVELLDLILQLPGIDANRPDNEGNTPLHFAAQAGQVECLNCLITRCRAIEIDARNNLGFTPLMKAALQGRNKCAKVLLFAGANPTLRDNGRGLRADQWARFCGRYICADVIEKHARQRLLERSTSYGNWGGENEMGARILLGKIVPIPQNTPQPSHGLKSKLRKVFRTSSGPENTTSISSVRLVTQLTSAALCASSPVLPTAPTVPPVVKSLIRPLTVPRLQITLVNNNIDQPNANLTNGTGKTNVQTAPDDKEKSAIIKPARTKKKK